MTLSKKHPHFPHRMVIYQFSLEGAAGKASGAMRVVEIPRTQKDGTKKKELVIEKLRLELYGHDNLVKNLILVDDDLSTPVYIDLLDSEVEEISSAK